MTTLSREQIEAQLIAQQKPVLGILASLGAMALGTALWVIITVVTNFQIGWMAIGVAFGIGWCMRTFGKTVQPIYGYIGAFLALMSCMMGNLFSTFEFIAQKYDTTLLDVAYRLGLDKSLDILISNFQLMDFVFYALALWSGYKYSFLSLKNLVIMPPLPTTSTEQ